MSKRVSYVPYLATISGAFSAISNGVNQAWTSPYLPKLTSSDSTIPTTSSEGSTCAMMAVLGAPMGAMIAATLLNYTGRKKTILLISPLIFLGYTTLALATTITEISIARFIIACAAGGLYTSLPIYISEIAPASTRGFLTSTIDFSSILGALIINVIGPFFSITFSSMVCLVLHAIHYISFVFMPESPYYYIKIGEFEEAKQMLVKLRGSDSVDDEMQELKIAVERQESNKKNKPWDLFLVSTNRKALLIFLVLAFAKQFSGHTPVIFYTTTIFETAETNIDATYSAIIYSTVRLFSLLPGLFMVDRFGRRIIVLASTISCALFLALEGLYFYLNYYKYTFITQHLQWLPITALMGYIFAFSSGISYAPVLFLGELFPTNIKAFALGFGDSYSSLIAAISAKYFQVTNDFSGMFVPFWSFSLVCAVSSLILFKILPETKGKTLEQIQLYLINKKW